MGKNSQIEWCDHSFNAWFGCERVSPACVRCYIERSPALRFRKMKLGDMPVRTKPAYWKEPLAWNREAEELPYFCPSCCERTLQQHCTPCEDSGVPNDQATMLRRPRVFCLSLGDSLDDRVPIEWLRDLLVLIAATPNLDWLLLTKRPQNFFARVGAVAEDWESSCDVAVWWMRGVAPSNVWIGITGENQEQYDKRTPDALAIPARVHFVSAEPLLGSLDLRLDGVLCPDIGGVASPGIDWVICGGETGPGARPMHPEWALSLRDQCQAAAVPFFFKQWGDWLPAHDWLLTHRSQEIQEFEVTNVSTPTPSGMANIDMWRVGKKTARRLLDGREWDEFPKVEVLA